MEVMFCSISLSKAISRFVGTFLDAIGLDGFAAGLGETGLACKAGFTFGFEITGA